MLVVVGRRRRLLGWCGRVFSTKVHGNNRERKREFMDKLFGVLDYKRQEDWYNLSRSDVLDNGGSSMFGDGKTSNVMELLMDVYPDKKWDICNFKRFPRGFWTNEGNRKQFLEHLAVRLGIKEPRDWCGVSYKKVVDNGGSSLLLRYGNLKNILIANFPQYSWEKWFQDRSDNDNSVVNKKKRNYWDDIDNQRAFMDDLGKKIGVKRLEDWNGVAKKVVLEHSGAPMIRKYSNMQELLETIYPHHEWNVLDRKIVPRTFWKDSKNHRMLLDSVIKKLNLSSPLELTSISKQTILDNGARSLFYYYSNLYDAVKSIYPEYNWNPLDFKPLPKNFWKDKSIQRLWMDKFAKDNSITSHEQWKEVNSRDIHDAGGRSILSQYPSFIQMLSELYPEYNWNIHRDRKVVPRGHWESRRNIVKFINEFKKQHNITDPSDWERVSKLQLSAAGGSGLLDKYKSIHNILEKAFPDEDWNTVNFSSKRKKAAQRYLFQQIRKIIGNIEVVEEYIHEELARESGFGAEFDIYIPSLQIAIEYQGEHHYKDIPAFGPVELYQERDIEKVTLCKKHNIHLVIIPYWTSMESDAILSQLSSQLPTHIFQYIFSKTKE